MGVLPHQIEFITSNYTHTGLVSGFGGGKSWAATLKIGEKKKRYPGVDVAYYLPTYGLIKSIAFPNIEKWLKQQSIPYELNRSDKEFITPLGKIIMRSTNDPDGIIGYEVGYSVIDEADVQDHKKMKNVVVKIVGRNRVPLWDGSTNCIDFVSTPEGFEFMYNFFVKEDKANRHLIKARSRDNPFLPESYFETLMDIYSEEQILAYLEGEFVNLTVGTVCRNFDRDESHSDREIKKGDILHIGMDFNVTNMTGIIHVIDGKIKTAVDEIVGVFDTAAMILEIKERYPGHRIIVYPDASGANRNTSGESDHKMLKDAKFKLRTPKKNPSVKDRVNVMNGALKNANGKRAYFINTNKCPETTEAFEKLPYKKGVPDKSSGYDHIVESAGYFIYENKKSKTTSIR